MKEETMGSSEPAYERLGAKVLSLPDVIAQSVGFMGPVFSSAFVIPLVVGVISASGKGGGVASPLSVLIAAVGVFALGWIVSSYAKEIHTAGSLYDYVTRGLGEPDHPGPVVRARPVRDRPRVNLDPAREGIREHAPGGPEHGKRGVTDSANAVMAVLRMAGPLTGDRRTRGIPSR
jgi:hypothetical protein